MTHKSEDYKISAVKYYINNDKSLDEVCEIFDCSRKSLYRWVKRYNEIETLERQNRNPESYKITKKQVKYALKKQKENEQITMVPRSGELAKIVKIGIAAKYNDFDITSQHLGQILRDTNITRKRTRHEHYPKERYNKPTNQTKELKIFYKEVRKYSLSKIICLDETSIKPAMYLPYSKCQLGRRCIIKTDDNYVFRKFTLLCAINNKKCVGTSLYKEGGMTKERFVEFLEQYIFSKYKNNLIILDNAGSHNNQYVKDAIIKSGNKYLFFFFIITFPYSYQIITNTLNFIFSFNCIFI